LRNH